MKAELLGCGSLSLFVLQTVECYPQERVCGVNEINMVFSTLSPVPLCGLAENEDHRFLYAACEGLGLGTCG